MHNLVSTLHTLFDVLEMLYFESLFRVRSMPLMERPREGWSPLTFEALSAQVRCFARMLASPRP